MACCRVGGIMYCDAFLCKLMGRIFPKKGNTKVDTRESWNIQRSYDAEGECKGATYYKKREGIISDSDPQKLKYSECPIWDFQIFAPQRIKHGVVSVTLD